ncbi:serine hydrolase domain-containing protein [Maribacter sp. 2-571]|uniref:serine hydrolase domain-containing protein n=1 Tax=Maribacter sp. 2-571 TaxID=3417569 RepID=UPI003D34A1B5
MKKLLKRIVVVLLLIFAVVAFINYPKLNLIAGYASKNMASNHFIAGRSQEKIIATDNDMPLIRLADTKVERASAVASVFGMMERTTVCREGIGCALVNDSYITGTKLPRPNRTFSPLETPFPYGNGAPIDSVFNNVDYAALEKAINGAFVDNDIQKTRTVLVAYKNHIIGERYLEGFSEKTPILGWSMTKSILATLYGVLAHQQKIDIDSPAPVPEWQNDPRKKITIDHLLRMQSGLAWSEDYASISDVTEMLFLDSDMTKKQLFKEAVAAPEAIWNYSSGTTNLLSGILRKQFATHQDYLDFPYRELIDKIGMHSMLVETDLEGNFVGSSYAWATTRDWAKFGILYLNRGNWNGEQLFAPEWVDYISKATAGSEGKYGAHFWLNKGGRYPNAPRDLYSANGFQGQRVFIIPSKDLVIVRMGLSQAPDFRVNALLEGVLEAIN